MLFNMTSASALQVSKEIRLHLRGQHQNIIGLYAAFQDSEGIYLVMVGSPHADSSIDCCMDLYCVPQVLHWIVYLSAAKEALGSVHMGALILLLLCGKCRNALQRQCTSSWAGVVGTCLNLQLSSR